LPVDAPTLHLIVAKWYARNARDLPWRRAPFLGDPYAVLVSEIMLQQTQVDRTIPKFLEFMQRFPTLEALAEATPGDAITAWAGMGYNGRAVRLQRLATVVVREFDGVLPSEPQDLRPLPGVGPYTASAVASFAFGATIPVLDTNIYRVLSRLVHGVKAPSRAAVEPLALELLPGDDAPLDGSTWHQALMDLGATICTANAPRCLLCPLRDHCAAAPELQGGVDRAVASASVPYTPKQSSFAGSQRFYRGRIVAALRSAKDAGLQIDEIGMELKDEFGGTEDQTWLDELIAKLVHDGLAVNDEGVLRLP
jgi:A/G-specific adenine glycosylase